LLKSTSLWTLDPADGNTMILWKSVNLSQSTWHTIQEEWNLQIFILPAIIYIKLRTKAIKMFLPRHILDDSQTHGSWIHFGINNICGRTT
jgi:hypothetical protein